MRITSAADQHHEQHPRLLPLSIRSIRQPFALISYDACDMRLQVIEDKSRSGSITNMTEYHD